MKLHHETQVLIIGGGATGTGLARDLSMRGIHCILAEKADIGAGASGANHGLLHSGARYAASDGGAAVECRLESDLLKRLAPHCVEDTGGLFVAVAGDDEIYVADFPDMCRRCGIAATPVSVDVARSMEPALSDRLIAAYAVPDAAVDPFKLALDNMAHACRLGAGLLRHARVTAFDRRDGRIMTARLRDTLTGEEMTVTADQVVNATGAWAGTVADLAGIRIPMVYSKGSLLVTQHRLAHHAVNRLRQAGDGDILMPGGTVSILGTTSIRTGAPGKSRPTIREVDHIIEQGAAMIPALESTRFIRAYSGVRPLISQAPDSDDRQVSRGFVLMDHAAEGVANFTTITGGKLTTYRLMAEKTADLICGKIGSNAVCRTREEILPPSDSGRWTEPGLSPKAWVQRNDPDDLILCECELVSARTVDRIISALGEQGGEPGLNAISRRSRIGKGPCQGAYCSIRLTAHLYDRGYFRGESGVDDLKAFLSERWRGEHPILWGTPLMQAELQEAFQCGLLGLER